MSGYATAARSSDKVFALLTGVRALSPASRRWRRFLSELPLDPDRLIAPIAQPTARDFILCGAPRTGTTLLSAMLLQPPDMITVVEPWDGMRLAPADLFASLRRSLGSSQSLAAGKLDMSALFSEGSVKWIAEGHDAQTVALTRDYALGVKWPAYWRLLPLLPNTRFLVTLRDPRDVIASFRRQGGRLRLGLEYATAFNRAMNEHLSNVTSDLALRRIRMFDYIHERILPHLGRSNVLVVRYERWFTDPAGLRHDIAEFLEVPLREGAARIMRPRASVIADEDRALIGAHCSTASALGYDLAA